MALPKFEEEDVALAAYSLRKFLARPTTEIRTSVLCAASPNEKHDLTFIFDHMGLMSVASACRLEPAVVQAGEAIGALTCAARLKQVMLALQDHTPDSWREEARREAKQRVTRHIDIVAANALWIDGRLDKLRAARLASRKAVAQMDENVDAHEWRARKLNKWVKPLIEALGQDISRCLFSSHDTTGTIMLRMFTADVSVIIHDRDGWRIRPEALTEKLGGRKIKSYCPVCGNVAATAQHRNTQKHKDTMRAFLEKVLAIVRAPLRYHRQKKETFTT